MKIYGLEVDRWSALLYMKEVYGTRRMVVEVFGREGVKVDKESPLSAQGAVDYFMQFYS